MLWDFKVKCDAETNPPEVVAKNELHATVYMFPRDFVFRTKLEDLDLDNDIDKIVYSLADALDFNCVVSSYNHRSAYPVYRWWLDDDDPRAKRIKELPLPLSRNPCYEILLHPPLSVTVVGASLQINSSRCSFDLNDPELVTKLKLFFSDLSNLNTCFLGKDYG